MTTKPIIFIIGCGSSGTNYIARVFRRGGVKIGHEKYGMDGLASWYLAPTIWTNVLKAPHRSDPWHNLLIKYKTDVRTKHRRIIILHQVRHPLKAISTFQRASNSSWEFVSDVLNIDKPVWIKEKTNLIEDRYRLYCCMYYWFQWNKMCFRLANLTYRIESFPSMFDDIMKLIKRPELIEKKDHMLDLPKNINTSKAYDPKTWKDLHSTDAELAFEIVKLSTEYGYELEND